MGGWEREAQGPRCEHERGLWDQEFDMGGIWMEESESMNLKSERYLYVILVDIS